MCYPPVSSNGYCCPILQETISRALVPFDVIRSRAPLLDVTAVEGQAPLSWGQPLRWGESKTLKQRRCAACVGIYVDGERSSPKNGSNLAGEYPPPPQATGHPTLRDGSTSNGTSARPTEYRTHYHHERNHQGKGNVLLFASSCCGHESHGPMQCRERLGGLLKYYEREAA